MNKEYWKRKVLLVLFFFLYFIVNWLLIFLSDIIRLLFGFRYKGKFNILIFSLNCWFGGNINLSLNVWLFLIWIIFFFGLFIVDVVLVFRIIFLIVILFNCLIRMILLLVFKVKMKRFNSFSRKSFFIVKFIFSLCLGFGYWVENVLLLNGKYECRFKVGKFSWCKF